MYRSNSSEKCLTKFTAVSAKTFKTVKCLPNVLFSIDIMDPYLLPCFYILFKRRLESVTKVFMSEVTLANFKILEPRDA